MPRRWPSILPDTPAPIAVPPAKFPRPKYPYPTSVVDVGEWQVYGYAGWTMPQVQSALDGIKVGSMIGGHQLLLEMQEDPIFSHGTTLRCESLVNTPFALEKHPDMPQEAFDALVNFWPQSFSDNECQTATKYRVPLGVAPASVTWTVAGGLYMPRIRVKETGNLTWDPVSNRYLFNSSDEGLIRIEDDGKEWVLFTSGAKYPHLDGAVRPLAVVWWLKQASLRYLNNFARVHGNPIRKVMMPAEQRESLDTQSLLMLAQTLFGGGVFPAPQYEKGQSFDLSLVEATSQSHGVFSTIIALCDEYITLRLLGAIDNSRSLGGAGSRARAEVHEKQTTKFLGSDCRVTSLALTKVLKQWCRYNLFPEEWSPTPKYEWAPTADQAELAEVRVKNANAMKTLTEALPLIEQKVQEQDPRARIDWKGMAAEHGVKWIDPGTEKAGALKPPEPEDPRAEELPPSVHLQLNGHHGHAPRDPARRERPTD